SLCGEGDGFAGLLRQFPGEALGFPVFDTQMAQEASLVPECLYSTRKPRQTTLSPRSWMTRVEAVIVGREVQHRSRTGQMGRWSRRSRMAPACPVLVASRCVQPGSACPRHGSHDHLYDR